MSTTTCRRQFTGHYGPQHVEYELSGDIADGTDGFDVYADGVLIAEAVTYRQMVAAVKAL